MEANKLFEESLEWLKRTYNKHIFFTERDLECILQKHIKDKIGEYNLNRRFQVLNDWPMESGKKYADLVIRNIDEADEFKVEVAVELKYEPDHNRKQDFPQKKFKNSVVFWNTKQGQSSVMGDIKRVEGYVEQGKATVAYAIFIDEGSRFFGNAKYSGISVDRAKWYKDWNKVGMAVLITRRQLN